MLGLEVRKIREHLKEFRAVARDHSGASEGPGGLAIDCVLASREKS